MIIKSEHVRLFVVVVGPFVLVFFCVSGVHGRYGPVLNTPATTCADKSSPTVFYVPAGEHLLNLDPYYVFVPP